MRTTAATHAKALGLLMLLASPCAMAHTIPVPDIEALYRAVNDPANVGATLQLARYTYRLSVTDPYGTTRPNGGRLELRRDMKLRGVVGDQAAAIISAYDLPPGSFPQTENDVNIGPNAAVRMGLGQNSLEWLTVVDARNGQANIDTGLQRLDPGSTTIRLDHVSSTGSARGLNALNFGPATSGQHIDMEILNSEFYDNDIGQAQGVRIGNFQGAVGSSITIRISGSHFWNQGVGCLVVNNNAVSSKVTMESLGNRYDHNTAGMIVMGAFSSNSTRANGNTIALEIRGDSYVENSGSVGDRGGLIVMGTELASNAVAGGENNSVNVKMRDTFTLDNVSADLIATGARFLLGQTATPTRNNKVTVEVKSFGTRRPVEQVNDVLPIGTKYGNTAKLVRN
jgi:hypothetical protein